jgi:hypothetical protein
MRAGRRGERGVGLTELSCSACCRVGRSRVAHHTSAMRHLCVVLTLHWLSIRYTAFILWICTCHGGSSSCTRPSTWLRNHSVSLRTWSRQAGQQGQGRGRRGFHLRGAHLLQLLALLLQLLQGPVPGLLLLQEREDMAVEAGRARQDVWVSLSEWGQDGFGGGTSSGLRHTGPASTQNQAREGSEHP